MTATDLHPDTGVPRPGTCCGACPPIAGGGWDCTCPGNPRCSVSAPAAEWDDLARLAQAAQELTPGEWVAGDGWVYTPPVYDDDHRLASVLGMKHADRDRANAEHARAQRNAEFIAAANPATILRLIRELQIAERASQANANAHMYAERKANTLAARLAAVEALLEWAETDPDRPYVITGEQVPHVIEARQLRATLSAPTDTTKEN